MLSGVRHGIGDTIPAGGVPGDLCTGIITLGIIITGIIIIGDGTAHAPITGILTGTTIISVTEGFFPFVNNRRQNGLYRKTYSRPELRKDGLAQYNKINPARPALAMRSINPHPEPVVTWPVKPVVTKPAPVVRPKPGTKPVIQPTRPGDNNPAPVTRPKPVTKPTKPIVSTY